MVLADMRRYLLLVVLIIISLHASAQSYVLTGKITGSTNKPVAFAAVYIKNSTYGSVSNEEGKYELKLDKGNYDVIYRFPGYKEVTEKLTITDHDIQQNVV